MSTPLSPDGDAAGAEAQLFPRTRLVDTITDHLRESIASGAMPPGTQLLQSELAQRFGVSRTPLREAFRVLERDGLVRMANGNKTVEVVAPTTEEVIDMYELREFLDGFAASLLARRGLGNALDEELGDCIETMRLAIGDLDIGRFGDAHRHFHTSILTACGNKSAQDHAHLVRMSSQMMVAHQMTRRRPVAELPEAARAILERVLVEGNRDHHDILEAIRSGDSGAAEQAARRHIRKGLRSIEALSSRVGPDRVN